MNNLFTDKVLKNVKSILTITISLILPILFYGFIDDFDIGLYLKIELGIVAITLIISNRNISKDASSRSMEAIIEDEKVKVAKTDVNSFEYILNEIQNINNGIKDHVVVLEFTQQYNKEKIEALQKEKQSILERTYSFRSVYGFKLFGIFPILKKRSKIKLENIKKEDSYIKLKVKYKYLHAKDITSSYQEKSKSEKEELHYNVVRNRANKRMFTSIISNFLTTTVMAIPLLLKTDIWNLVAFVVLVVLMYTATYVTDYILAGRDTRTKYKSSLKLRLKLLNLMNEYIRLNNTKKVREGEKR